MAKCPNCRSTNVTVEQKKIEIDQESTSHLVLRSWLQPGGILKNRKQYRTETTCRCEDCGHTWQPRSWAEIGMAIIGGVILLCVLLLEIFGK